MAMPTSLVDLVLACVQRSALVESLCDLINISCRGIVTCFVNGGNHISTCMILVSFLLPYVIYTPF